MKSKQILFLIPALIVIAIVINCWWLIFTNKVSANWRHHIALDLMLVIVYIYFINFKWAVVGMLIFLLLGTINILSITAELSKFWINIGSLKTPPIHLLSFGLLHLFCVLNYFNLVEIYVDYKERDKKNK